MQKTYRYKPRYAAQIPLAVKGLALIFFLCVVIRVFSALGADSASKKYMSGLVANESFVDGILDFELGAVGQPDNGVTIASLLFDSSILTPATPDVDLSATPSPTSPPEVTGSSTGISGYGLYYNDWYMHENAPETTPNVITKPNNSPDYIAVNNQTDYVIDTAALLKEPLNIILSGDSPGVLILHTHGSEAYMPDGDDQYVESDPYKTQDKYQSVIRIGDELASELAKKGIAFIHDRNFYDYPSYSGSYNRSYDAVQSYLKEYPSIKIVIDVHRDAIEDKAGNVYRTIAQVGDTTCAQVMFVMGSNFSGLNHPNWKENFKLALHIQDEMNSLYPSLAKPMKLSQYRFGQNATTGSMIVEVGSIGNTLQEALTAIRYFADALSNVVLGLYE